MEKTENLHQTSQVFLNSLVFLLGIPNDMCQQKDYVNCCQVA